MLSYITNKWNEYLEKFEDSSKDIYYFEEYVKLYEDEEGIALCAVCVEENNILLMPYIRKTIGDYYDFETAYGYGGPIANTHDNTWINKALDEMTSLFRKEKYLCGFVRFHPLLNNALNCKEHLTLLFDRNTIAINTEESEDSMWTNQIVSKNRNMIRKAEKNNLVYKAEYDFASLEDFVKLYNLTMERLDAEDFYFFNNDYYEKFKKDFSDKAFLGTVRKDDELICGALFMYTKDYGHYHLEGSNHEYSKLAANNLLLWKTAVELNKLGIKEFHLGGGYNSEPDNSLLKFKKSFSNNIKDFYIGKWIFDEDKYCEVKGKWAKENPDKVDKFGNLLLCYRY